MSTDRASADDFEDHVSSTAVAGNHPTKQFPPGAKPNAFTEMMKPKHKQPPNDTTDRQTQRTLFSGRDGLAAYTLDPASFPDSRVVYFNDKFVVINDLFPKASVHLLILPRDAKKSVQRPQEAFDDPKFLEECREEEKKVRKIVAEELRRKYGRYSKAEQERIAAMEAEEPPDEPPPGRDWHKEVKSGIHANPSMSHLHIHVISPEMVSDPMKKTNHYLSFNTDFFVGLDEFPLPENDHRRNYKHFPEDMHCWRCGKNFKNKIMKLKEHLAQEFKEWKRE